MKKVERDARIPSGFRDPRTGRFLSRRSGAARVRVSQAAALSRLARKKGERVERLERRVRRLEADARRAARRVRGVSYTVQWRAPGERDYTTGTFHYPTEDDYADWAAEIEANGGYIFSAVLEEEGGD